MKMAKQNEFGYIYQETHFFPLNELPKIPLSIFHAPIIIFLNRNVPGNTTTRTNIQFHWSKNGSHSHKVDRMYFHRNRRSCSILHVWICPHRSPALLHFHNCTTSRRTVNVPLVCSTIIAQQLFQLPTISPYFCFSTIQCNCNILIYEVLVRVCPNWKCPIKHKTNDYETPRI